MTKKNNIKKRHSKITSVAPLITSSEEIICPERPITISDEKLKNLLSRAYEQARRNAAQSHWHNNYITCFSFGIAFLIPLLTTDIKNKTSQIIFWMICIIFLFIGFIMVGWTFLCKDKNLRDENIERDLTVENIMKNNVLTPKNPEMSSE